MKKKNFGKIVLVAAGIMTGAFAVLHTVGKRNKKKNEAGIDDDNQYLNKTDDGKKPSAHHKTSGYERVWKPVIDKALSFAGLVVLAPIYGLISLAIVIDDPGPVLFTQKRVGKDKHFFKLHKFRSMKMSTPHDVPTHKLEDPEQYITRVGKLLRKTSLDELPQIWDIFVGNMSIIGPRPALWNQDDLIAERDKFGANNVTPGLTGWAQINGRDELEIPAKAKLDGDYVSIMRGSNLKAFVMDIKCFFGTIHSVAHSDGVVEGGTGEIKKMQHSGKNLKNTKLPSSNGWKNLNIMPEFSQNSVDSIRGKKILFFAPAFFGYEYKIKAKMEEMGASCDCYDVRSVTSAMNRAFLKIFPKIFDRQSERYYDKILTCNADKQYDYVLIVKCDMTPVSSLKHIRALYPNAKICLMLWDSVENIPGIVEKFKFFDTCHSFDMDDCKKYSDFKFRPLFYSDEFKKNKTDKADFKYDISFIGTIHSDRFKVIKTVQNIAMDRGLSIYFYNYLQSRFIYYFYRLTKSEFKGTKETDFSFKKMNSDEIATIVSQSKIVLDIQHPKQTGLTMRTIEMIGMNKKLITTNKAILNYNFYNPKNISIIDRNNVILDDDFLDANYEPLTENIYDYYSLEKWILTALS